MQVSLAVLGGVLGALAWWESGDSLWLAGAVVLVATGTVMGLAAGAVRMAQGGHFFSDVIFAGVAMALSVLLVRWLMFGRAFMPALRRRFSLRGEAP